MSLLDQIFQRQEYGIEKSVEEFNIESPRLVAYGDRAALKELFCRLTTKSQMANRHDAIVAKDAMRNALREAVLNSARYKLKTGKFTDM